MHIIIHLFTSLSSILYFNNSTCVYLLWYHCEHVSRIIHTLDQVFFLYGLVWWHFAQRSSFSLRLFAVHRKVKTVLNLDYVMWIYKIESYEHHTYFFPLIPFGIILHFFHYQEIQNRTELKLYNFNCKFGGCRLGKLFYYLTELRCGHKEFTSRKFCPQLTKSVSNYLFLNDSWQVAVAYLRY